MKQVEKITKICWQAQGGQRTFGHSFERTVKPMALEAIWHHLYKHLFYSLHLGIDSIVLNLGFNLKKSHRRGQGSCIKMVVIEKTGSNLNVYQEGIG